MNESPYVLDQDFVLEFKKVKKIRKKVREALAEKELCKQLISDIIISVNDICLQLIAGAEKLDSFCEINLKLEKSSDSLDIVITELSPTFSGSGELTIEKIQSVYAFPNFCTENMRSCSQRIDEYSQRRSLVLVAEI